MVEAYKATLKFIRSMAGLAAMVYVAYLVVPKLDGLARWVSGIDKALLLWMVGLPVAGATVVACFAIYAIFFRGTKFIERMAQNDPARKQGPIIDV